MADDARQEGRRAPSAAEADAAFALAEQQIREARERQATRLALSLKSLTRLPSLAGLAALETLDLEGTQISELAPLRELRALKSLCLRGTNVSNIEELARLTSLRFLILWETNIPDLRPLAGLHQLESLDLMQAGIQDLTPLENLRNLRSLDVSHNDVSDLCPIAKLVKLNFIRLSHIKASDLSPLTGMTGLNTLHANGAPIVDLRPLARLSKLSNLDIGLSRVADIGPLAGLRKLQFFNFSATSVSDLSPVAEMTSLIDAAADRAELGLSFHGCPISDPIVKALGELNNPDRTVKTINHLRNQRSLPPYDPSRNETETDKAVPPALPAQKEGPHFAIRADGILDFAPPDALDADGNNFSLMRGLQPQLIDLARALQQSLTHGNAPHVFLVDTTNAYAAEIEKSLTEIDYWKLTGVGILLENAAIASERKIADRDLPELSDPQKARLDSLLSLHGAFILATHQGRAVLSRAERYRPPPDSATVTRHAAAFANALRQHPEVIAPQAAAFVEKSVTLSETRDSDSKSAVYGDGASSNSALIIAAAASIYVAPMAIGAIVGGPIGGLAGAVLGQLGFKVLEKMGTFDSLMNRAAQSVEKLPMAVFEKYVLFLLDNEASLRGMAGTRSSMQWLHRHLDWLKASYRRN